MVIINLKDGTRYRMDGILKNNLDSLVYNLPNDWDFAMIISGDNMVRVGKSVLAQQVGAYCAEKLGTKWDIENITMNGKEMMDFANNNRRCVIVYDEAAEGLRAAKNAEKVTQELIQFFDECGQLNHIFIIVAPNFFKLKHEIAVERTEYLLNVYRTGYQTKDKEGNPVVKLVRGQFQFFDRVQKLRLFERYRKMRQMNYSGMTRQLGNFSNTYTVDEAVYRQKKKDALHRMQEEKPQYYKKEFNDLLANVKREFNMTGEEVMERFNVGLKTSQIYNICKENKEIPLPSPIKYNHNSIKNGKNGRVRIET